MSGLPHRYKQLSTIGEGYAATVSKCLDQFTGAKVALKQLRREHLGKADQVSRFQREIELLRELAGVKGVIDLLDEVYEDDRIAYVMPLGECNLHTYIKSNNDALDLGDRIQIAEDLISTMQEAHNLGVLHRDIAPQNVIVLQQSPLKLAICDFGFGKSAAEMAQTQTGATGFGHAYYVAPEQAESLRRATIQSDIHALGKLLSFIATGKDPDRNRNCAFSIVIQKATQENPANRYQSLAELSMAFQAIKDTHRSPAIEDNRSYLASLGTATSTDWVRFHNAIIAQQYFGHVFYGYIDPIITHLRAGANLIYYYQAVGADIHTALSALVDEINNCIGTVGWPFKETGRFGDILASAFSLCREDEVKLLCICALWDLAYGADQWSVQKTVEQILTSNALPPSIHTSVAAHVVAAGVAVAPERFASTRLPVPIRNAINRIAGSD